MLIQKARVLGALILGAALAMPLAATAQAPAAGKPSAGVEKPDAAKAASDKALADRPTPTTAPTKDAGNVPPAPATTADAPKVSSPPTPSKGSTAVPGWNNPPAWGGASERPGYASVPGVDTNRLIQGAGREWRAFRNGPLTRFGGWFVVAALAVVILLYLVKGRLRLHGAPTGRLIERFNAVERASHWVMAISFVFLALTGIIILWGKHIILPWLGYSAFSGLTVVSKNVHNFVGPLFIFSLVVMFLIYVKDNMPRAGDLKWILTFGGMFSGKEIPSGRFNGMEKAWFWFGLVLLGIVMSVTGLILDFPNWNQGREAMQQANVIHVIAAVLFIAGSLGHIYMGLAVEGAYRGMRDGYVDETWAKEHHSIWYDEVKQGKRPEKIVTGTAQPAPGDD
ncbi:MAG TPA: formate dehydrogenase subunit gamma [Usitatibacter sp.]|nr:formate dehydrogenase subunit gamma [Usitatibacter sp.]